MLQMREFCALKITLNNKVWGIVAGGGDLRGSFLQLTHRRSKRIASSIASSNAASVLCLLPPVGVLTLETFLWVVLGGQVLECSCLSLHQCEPVLALTVLSHSF